MKKSLFYTFAFSLALGLTACSDGDDTYIDKVLAPIKGDSVDINPGDGISDDNYYRELWRPQIHYTPAKNWINDPNGLVYLNGTWHMYYQYNPSGEAWGNMSWGHATSTDLFHWKEQPVALTPDELGYIYSGSAVVDKNNTAGFGENAIVAIYTAHGNREQQCIAYSTDGGMTFTKYSGNPVVRNSTYNDFRDPKVFWDDTYQKWYMIVALGNEHRCQIYASDDLKTWKLSSTFSVSNYSGCNTGCWVCPDMFPITYKGERKYVITVNTSNGHPNANSSGVMYFVGNWNGARFTLDQYDYPLWEDEGLDAYASVTWSNAGDRHVAIAWMNDQLYSGDYPCSPWRSAMTLPREQVLEEYNGRPLMKSTIVKEIEGLAGEWRTAGSLLDVKDAYQLKVPVSLASDCVITLSNGAGNKYKVKVDAQNRELIIDRGGDTGAYSSARFPLSNVRGKLNTDASDVVLNFYVDQSSVEITTDDGSMIMTTLVFPASIYNMLKVDGQTVNAQVRDLARVWSK